MKTTLVTNMTSPQLSPWNPAVTSRRASIPACCLFFAAIFVFWTGEMARAASVSWSGAGVTDSNWSTAGNWSGAAAPGAADDVQFLDTGSSVSAGSPNNFVDNSFAGTIGSLRYANQNGFH